MAIWNIVLTFGIFYDHLVSCASKNLATLGSEREQKKTKNFFGGKKSRRNFSFFPPKTKATHFDTERQLFSSPKELIFVKKSL
jgi:hypothetical protein